MKTLLFILTCSIILFAAGQTQPLSENYERGASRGAEMFFCADASGLVTDINAPAANLANSQPKY